MEDPFREQSNSESAADAAAKRAPGFPGSSGYVDTGNTPYDRLRSSLRRLFPHFPDVFDFHSGARPSSNDESKTQE